MTSAKQLEGKVAIVTGAGAGIGRASALLFAKEGASAVCVDRDGPAVHELVNEFAGIGAKSIAMEADVSNAEDVERVVSETFRRFGRVDILFNVAGIVPHGKIHEVRESDWDRAMEVNVKSVYLFSREIGRAHV